MAMRMPAIAGVVLLLASPVLAAGPFLMEDRIPVGAGPNVSRIAWGGRLLIVANSDTDDVSRIDLASGQALAPVPVGRVPLAIALSRDEATAYVACFRGRCVAEVDVKAGRLVRTIPVGVTPYDVVRVGSTLLVSGYYEGKVVTIDTASGQVGAGLDLDVGLHRILVHPDGKRAYVLNTSCDALYELSLAPLALRAKLRDELGYGGAWDMAMTPDGARICISMWVNDQVAFVDTKTFSVAGFCATGGHGPCALALGPEGKRLVVPCSEADTAAVIDAEHMALRGVLPVGRFPFSHACVSPDGRWALVTADDAGTLAILDLDRIETVDTLPVGRIPHYITAGPSNRFYVSNTGEGTVAVVRQGTRRERAFELLHRTPLR